MKDEKDHPCFGCEYFEGYEFIETMDSHGRGYNLHVDVPICGYRTYVLALGLCQNYKKSEIKTMLENKQNETT